jgi:hypothetical protein
VLAGSYVYIPAGSWAAYRFDEPSIVYESEITGRKTVVEGLFALTQTWVDREHSLRAIGHFTTDNLFVLHQDVGVHFARFLNELNRCPVAFSFPEPKDGGVPTSAWRLPVDYSPLIIEEAERVTEIGMCAAVARGFLHPKVRNMLTVGKLFARNWGRVTVFCHANLGLTFYQIEHDKAKGLPKSERRGLRGDTEAETETAEGVGEVEEEPVTSPPRAKRGRRGTTARGAGRGRAGARSAARGGRTRPEQ